MIPKTSTLTIINENEGTSLEAKVQVTKILINASNYLDTNPNINNDIRTVRSRRHQAWIIEKHNL